MENATGLYVVGGGALAYLLFRAKSRLELSFAKHPSLAGHPRIARRIAAQMPNYTYSDDEALTLDSPPAEIVLLRRRALLTLTNEYAARFPLSVAQSAQAQSHISDMQFVSAYRVPFQFRKLLDGRLKIGSFVKSSSGVMVTDLDDNSFYDLTGSYGVNLFGYDFYKTCILQGNALVQDLGPVLGAYHPVVADNADRLARISGMDEVSFHMSGTEAVMQAVRLARYHTGRTHLLRFCGAYHGWWGDVQPGIGNPTTAKDTYTLSEMSAASLKILARRNDIACVLINPLQALHPNASAPSDSALIDGSRSASYSRADYAAWLQELRDVCDEKNIALIFDEVFVGFRLAPGGAQEYFDVRADMVTYGKTLGGGLPVGVVCGKRRWMKRFRDDAPADICFARGTFNSHPYVMGAMNAFLQSLATPPIQALYSDLDETWNRRAASLNDELRAAGMPVQVANMSSIWTVLYLQAGCYHWLFQFYLRLEGLALSWVGTGRIIFSLNYDDKDFEEVTKRFVRAAQRMNADGWWWRAPSAANAPDSPVADKAAKKLIRRRVLREMISHRLGL